MIYQVCSVYDSKARAFLSPFFVSHVDVAKRTFADVAVNPEHNIGRNPGDYTLFHLGTFDDDTAVFKLTATYANLGLATNYIKGASDVRKIA